MILLFELILLQFLPVKMSPTVSTYNLVQDKIEFEKVKRETLKKSEELKQKFLKNEVQDFVKKPSNLPNKPNMSQNLYHLKIIIIIRLQHIEV